MLPHLHHKRVTTTPKGGRPSNFLNDVHHSEAVPRSGRIGSDRAATGRSGGGGLRHGSHGRQHVSGGASALALLDLFGARVDLSRRGAVPLWRSARAPPAPPRPADAPHAGVRSVNVQRGARFRGARASARRHQGGSVDAADQPRDDARRRFPPEPPTLYGANLRRYCPKSGEWAPPRRGRRGQMGPGPMRGSGLVRARAAALPCRGWMPAAMPSGRAVGVGWCRCRSRRHASAAGRVPVIGRVSQGSTSSPI